MEKHDVAVFKPYAFKTGQRIHIEEGPRKGDWEVLDTTERKVRLRCPISSREFEWDRFCYLVETRTGVEWPQRDPSSGDYKASEDDVGPAGRD